MSTFFSSVYFSNMKQKKTSETAAPERSTWTNPIEFVLSLLGYAIGLGNVWRFPYLCYRNGGGAFVFAYLIMVLLMGMPIFLLELVLGQYSGLGPDQAFKSIAPITSGLGYCTLLVITLVTIYYMVIIAWTIFYFFASFTSELGFGTCNNDFNTMECFSAGEEFKCLKNQTYYNKRCTLVSDICKSKGYSGAANKTYCLNGTNPVHISHVINRTLASYEYFRDYVLGIGKSDWYHFGTLKWDVVLCLLFSWLLCYFCVLKGVKTIGKVAYFTSLFPYVMLTALVIQGAILEGAADGILLYITPKWELLLTVEVWGNAASQTFYSFGISCGSLITLASYNSFTRNCVRDTFIITGAIIFTSIYAGIAVFAMLGFLAHQMDVPVRDVVDDGPGLAFVAYPEAILRLPGSTFWSISFFFMLITLGMGSQFPGVEAINSLLLDKWPKLRKHEIYVTMGICIFCFVMAIPMCFNGGVYLFTLLEWNTASWAIFLIGVGEVGIVSWSYGCNRFLDHIVAMKIKLYKPVRWFWWACWVVITPLTLLGVFAFQMATYTPAYYESYSFPSWADALGLLMGLCTLAPLIIFAVYVLVKREYKGWQLFKPTDKWGQRSQDDAQATDPAVEATQETT